MVNFGALHRPAAPQRGAGWDRSNACQIGTSHNMPKNHAEHGSILAGLGPTAETRTPVGGA
jgi:hypothetical protein